MSTHTNNPVANAVRWALLAGSAVAAASPAIAFAADDKSGEDVERIEVTGSRIKRTDIEGANPVLTISRADIENTGLTDMGALLQQVPAAGAAINRTFNNGGDGAVRVDLRNLGTARTLVLVNGRRWVNSGTGADSSVDLNTIPLNVVERVEVLKDGASSIYGSDAIAGVINIITRKDFEGVQINAQTGQYEHGDGESQQIDLTMGATSEKGNVTLGLNWNNDKPVWAGDRVFSKSGGVSSTTPQGRFTNIDPSIPFRSTIATPCPTGNCTAANYRAYTGADAYNFNPDNYLLTPSERRGMFIMGNYQLTDSVSAYAEANYQNRRSDQTLAAMPVTLGTALGDDTVISATNPYNWTGHDLDANYGGDDGWGVQRRFVEGGFRNFAQDIDTFRTAVGLTGDFSNGWSWDANYIYGSNASRQITEGLYNTTKIKRALGDADTCTGFGDGCVPLNVFGGVGSITPEMLKYVTFEAHDEGKNEMEELSANLTGDIIDLPAGPLGFALGYAHRTEEGYFKPDALIQTGETTGNAQEATEGHFSVEEAYVEFNVPLVSDVAFADSIELSVATRYSDYDTFGSTTNTKAGITWRINPEFMVRGTWSEGFRAPSIAELFGGQSDNFPQVVDPCDSQRAGIKAGDDHVLASQNASCVADGVPANFTQPNDQFRTTTGSNDKLQPETSESVTAGIVYSPSWYEGSSITVDWYKIDIDNVVTVLGAQYILDQCYTANGSGRSLCDKITRTSTGFIDDLVDTNENGANLHAEGVDFNFTTPSHETAVGSFKFSVEAAYVAENDQTDAAGTVTSNAGVLYSGARDNNPRWKANTNLDWNYGDWSANWGTRYIHHVKEFESGDTLSSVLYNDIQVSYNLADYKTRLTLGIDNFLDEDPPFTDNAFANRFDPSYSMPGPYGYVRATVSF